MRKFTSSLCLAFICLGFACQTTESDKPAEVLVPSPTDAAIAKNLEAMHTVNRAFETGDFSAVRGLLADDAIDHSGPTGEIKGADSILNMMQGWAKMASNMKSTIIKELADKDYVFQWMTSSGTMLEDGFGMKKGQTYHSDAIEVTKFNTDGKMSEHWTFVSYGEMMKMMGEGAK